MKTNDSEIKYLSEKYKKETEDDFYNYINYILQDEYTTKYQNLRLVINNAKTKGIYEYFVEYMGIDNLLSSVIFVEKERANTFKESGIYDINGEKKVVINPKNNIRDIYDLVKYTAILDYQNKGNDEIVSYIKAMLLEKFLTDYLIKMNFAKTECEKMKMCNLMENVYISNIVDCSIKEAKEYKEHTPIDSNIFLQTKQRLKTCINCEEEISKYNFINTKKYIYGIIYSTYLHQKFMDEQAEELYRFLDRTMNIDEFKVLYDIEKNLSKVYEYYNKEYRS